MISSIVCISRYIAIALALLCLNGCASTKNDEDPLEPLNRKVYQFNMFVDSTVLKPTAQAYVAITPTPLRTAIHNFFANLDDIYVALNNALQGKWQYACNDIERVIFNSSFGLLGLIDVASPMGLEQHNEDFGQTLGYWGVSPGPYLVLPFLGPSTLRDSINWPTAYLFNPIRQVSPSRDRWALWGTKFIDARANLLPIGALLESAAFDPYIFVRDAYLQRRYHLIYADDADDADDADTPSLDNEMLDDVDAIRNIDVPRK